MNKLALMTVLAATTFAVGAQRPSDTDIKQLLIDRIGTDSDRVGIVVGIIDASGRRVVAYGRASEMASARPLDGDTVFEIASISKVFTSLLLADMVQRKEVALTDPVSRYLPSSVRVPERGGRAITLQDLSMHVSGLPRMPTNWIPGTPNTPERLYEFLNGYTLTRDIGDTYEYSTLGAGLLGHALSLKAGSSYEALLRDRICDPLKMVGTSLTVNRTLQSRVARGHNFQLEPVDRSVADALGSAWAVSSSANDLLRFLAATLGFMKSRLAPAMAAMVVPRKSQGVENQQMALGWQVESGFGGEILWHSGGNNGYAAFAGYNAKTHTGVVALSNAVNVSVNDIGRHLLDERFDVDKSPGARPRRRAITLGAETLDRYTGQYDVEGTPQPFNWSGTLTVIREGNRLFVHRSAWGANVPSVEVFAETDRQFFFKNNGIVITFETPSSGRAIRLVLNQNGRTLLGRRIGEP